MNDDESIPLDEKEPWQVVGCPQCKAPPGMRCTASRMQTHGLRRRAFAVRLEKEGFAQDKTGRGHAQRLSQSPDLDDTHAATSQSKASGSSRGGIPAAGSPSRRDWRSAATTAVSNQKTGKPQRSSRAVTPSPAADGAQPHKVEANSDWESLAAQLRKDRNLTESKATPSSKSSLPATPCPEVALPRSASAAPSSSPAPFLPATSKPFKQDDTQVWRLHACPLCRARPGYRCFGTLGQELFMSHAARLKVHASSTTPQFPATSAPLDKDSHD